MGLLNIIVNILVSKFAFLPTNHVAEFDVRANNFA